jgi:hypothetical protein
LHSPFYEQRFFPESYILKAITFLKLCAFDRVNETLDVFKTRFTPAAKELKSLIDSMHGRPDDFYKIVARYEQTTLDKYKAAWPIIDSLMRNDKYTSASPIVENADKEVSKINQFSRMWHGSQLSSDIEKQVKTFKSVVMKTAGEGLYADANRALQYLAELQNQSKLITAELMLGKVDELRAKLHVTTADKKDRFIGGLTPLKVGEKLEYWPFEGEYWKDELGGYVYNIPSRCK